MDKKEGPSMHGKELNVKEVVDRIAAKCPESIRREMEQKVAKILQENASAKEALGFTPAMMEELYDFGHKQFRAGKYGDAIKIFSVLMRLDPQDPRFSFGMGACYQYQKNYADAACYYSVSQQADYFNPLPAFHLYDCWMQLDQPVLALLSLREAWEVAKLDARYREFEEKIGLEIRHVESILPEKMQQLAKRK